MNRARPSACRSRRARAPRPIVSVGAALTFALAMLVTSCGGDDNTTTVEPPSSEDQDSDTSSTIVTSEAGIDAIVQTWVQLGFTEDQARCLVEKTSEVSSQIESTDPDAISAADQNLVERLMKDCGIDDASLKGTLGG